MKPRPQSEIKSSYFPGENVSRAPGPVTFEWSPPRSQDRIFLSNRRNLSQAVTKVSLFTQRWIEVWVIYQNLTPVNTFQLCGVYQISEHPKKRALFVSFPWGFAFPDCLNPNFKCLSSRDLQKWKLSFDFLFRRWYSLSFSANCGSKLAGKRFAYECLPE